MKRSKILKGKKYADKILLLIQTAEDAFIIVYAQGNDTYIKDFISIDTAMEKYNEIIGE